MIKRIGILTAGGDCPGLNPAIKWVVKRALDERLTEERGYACEVIGIRDGWRGLVKYDPRYPVLPAGYHAEDWTDRHYARVLTEAEVRTWDRQGGTRLGTSRFDLWRPGQESWQRVLETIELLKLDGIVAIGGDDTLMTAGRLVKEGARIVCIPKTIDRHLPGTDYTLGFESALSVIVQEIDRLRTTAASHSRTFIVETMGRNTGHLALSGGLAAGADIVLIPEVPFTVERVVELLRAKRQRGYRYAIVVAAEGALEAGCQLTEEERAGVDREDHSSANGIAKLLEKRIEEGTGAEVRSVQLSHLQRGGIPCALDRRLARLFGIAAVQLVEEGRFGQMVAYRDGEVTAIPIPEKLDELCTVDVARRYDVERLCPSFTLAKS